MQIFFTLIPQIDEKFILDVFLRKKFGGNNYKKEINLIRPSLLKIFGSFFWIINI